MLSIDDISKIFMMYSGVEVYQRRLRHFNRAKAVEKEIAQNWMVVKPSLNLN